MELERCKHGLCRNCHLCYYENEIARLKEENAQLKEERKMSGDRECPECGEMTLVEKGLTQWECIKCGKVYEAEWLDDGERDE